MRGGAISVGVFGSVKHQRLFTLRSSLFALHSSLFTCTGASRLYLVRLVHLVQSVQWSGVPMIPRVRFRRFRCLCRHWNSLCSALCQLQHNSPLRLEPGANCGCLSNRRSLNNSRLNRYPTLSEFNSFSFVKLNNIIDQIMSHLILR